MPDTEEKVHTLSNPRQIVVYDAWAVYKDYDGNAPDGHDVVFCATEELAEQVATIIGAEDEKRRESEENGDEEDESTDDPFVDFPWPHVDGCEWSAHWKTQKTYGQAHEIAHTVSEAIRRACDSE